MATKNPRAKKQSPEQTKIPGTGRIDACEPVEDAAFAYQKKVAAREQAEDAEKEAQDALTQALIDNKLSEYKYEGKDGIPYIAYVPKDKKPKAKVRKVIRKKPEKAE